MTKYIHDGDDLYKVEFISVIEDGKVYVLIEKNHDIYSYREHHLKTYYRPERTWDDHMGNTPCGYYVNLPISKGRTKRVYIH